MSVAPLSGHDEKGEVQAVPGSSELSLLFWRPQLALSGYLARSGRCLCAFLTCFHHFPFDLGKDESNVSKAAISIPCRRRTRVAIMAI
jgi:hypothetical protein